ncbi:hypothetical protein B0H14DRAFT_1534118 [Mycena olivaceomarginata]|nr:hypothetical protein B0H14DRAFT_1534118 [Mycena olivaceomarginata]
MTPRTDEQVNGRQIASPAAMADVDDSRSVSSLATSSSHVRMRRGKQPARTAMRSQHSRSRSRKGGTRVTGHGKEGSAPQFGVSGLPLPLTNLAAAAALVERNANSARQKVVVQTTDEEDGTEDGDEDGWTEDDSAEGTESVEVVEEEEPEQEGDEEWEDEDSEIVEQSGPAVNAKAPPPSLQQQQPHPHLGHSRGHSTSGAATTGTDLRQLPNRPHRSAGHLPSLAHGGPAPAKHQHTTSAQNARTSRALKATMSATSLSSAMLEAQRQRELFAKAPRISYENLPQLATRAPRRAHPSAWRRATATVWYSRTVPSAAAAPSTAERWGAVSALAPGRVWRAGAAHELRASAVNGRGGAFPHPPYASDRDPTAAATAATGAKAPATSAGDSSVVTTAATTTIPGATTPPPGNGSCVIEQCVTAAFWRYWHERVTWEE